MQTRHPILTPPECELADISLRISTFDLRSKANERAVKAQISHNVFSNCKGNKKFFKQKNYRVKKQQKYNSAHLLTVRIMTDEPQKNGKK